MMKRKEFIKIAALSGGYLASTGTAAALPDTGKEKAGLTAAALQQYLISHVRLKPDTVDRFIIGNPETVVKKIGTCWISDWETCRKAVDSGVNVLITHEPTFYTHRDLDEKTGDYFSAPEFTKNIYLDCFQELFSF